MCADCVALVIVIQPEDFVPPLVIPSVIEGSGLSTLKVY